MFRYMKIFSSNLLLLLSSIVLGDELFGAEANQFHCGSMIVELQEDWSIVSIDIKKGSLQNARLYQQKEGDESAFVPKFANTTLAHFKQAIDDGKVEKLSIMEFPLEAEMVIAQPHGSNITTFHLTKGVCNALQTGQTSVTLKAGNPMSITVYQSERDSHSKLTDLHKKANYTPAYVLLPFNDPDSQESNHNWTKELKDTLTDTITEKLSQKAAQQTIENWFK
ncbi:hypothetical protein GV64_06240 [Endozoicomonas elysicola]|uniref:DUF2057 domain-containing protein n=2 Tax=Endozoicomonas elysicola TaxID=305900 RepID=A0A081K8A5_9GAMM|nr:hypothetical protein GV64_06240 [Endozoicomonas elysicola]